jgi:hypothetical protein
MTELRGEFRAFSAFFYTLLDLGIIGWNEEKKFSRKEIREAAAVFCRKEFNAVVLASKSGDPQKIYPVCCSGFFIAHILEAYGFAETDNTSITFGRKIAGVSADWTMGAALYETSLLPLHLV